MNFKASDENKKILQHLYYLHCLGLSRGKNRGRLFGNLVKKIKKYNHFTNRFLEIEFVNLGAAFFHEQNGDTIFYFEREVLLHRRHHVQHTFCLSGMSQGSRLDASLQPSNPGKQITATNLKQETSQNKCQKLVYLFAQACSMRSTLQNSFVATKLKQDLYCVRLKVLMFLNERCSRVG